jgi:hypothetical protein
VGSSGKRLTDLHFRDEPEDVRNAPWFQFIAQIDELLDSGEYDWADYTLRGIKSTVDRTHTVTEGQQRAVANIQAGTIVRNKYRPRTAGSFDGFNRRRYAGHRGDE